MYKITYVTLILALVFTGCKKESNSDVAAPASDEYDGGSLFIDSQSSLDKAISFGSSLNSIGGSLFVTTGAVGSITAADVNQISSQIKSVGGDVIINTPDGSLDLSQLTTVGGDYTILGSDANDDNLTTIDGDLSLNYDGDYDMPNLESVGNVILTPSLDPSASNKASKGNGVARSIRFARLSNCISFRTARSPIGHLTLSPSIRYTPYSEISLGNGVKITSVLAPAVKLVKLSYPSALPSLNIVAPLAKSIDISSSLINGSFNVKMATTPDSKFIAAALERVQGDIDIECGSVELKNLTTIEGNAKILSKTILANKVTTISGNLSIISNDVSMTTLKTVGGNLTVTGASTDTTTANSVNFESLTNVGGEVEIDAGNVTINTGQPHNSGGNTHNSGGN